MSLLHDVTRLVREHYVIETDIDAIVAALPPDLPPDADPETLANELTRCLRSVNHDGHLGVRHRPDGVVETGDEAGWHARERVNARQTSGGFAEVRRLDTHTGLVAISPYTPPVDLAAPYLAAVFVLMRDVEHLVLDLRRGFGGVPETVALICSYLVPGPEPVLLQEVVSRHEPAHQFWTTPTEAALPTSTRVSVLTSARTFSGCEELAYNLQALGRSRTYGETTGGGAHPVEVFRLTDELQLSVPVAMAVNAVTGTNWEQVGVVPDVPCPADDALDVALAEASQMR